MGVVNRRNAVLGWTAWKFGKRVLKRKAKAAVPGTRTGSRAPNAPAILAVVAAVVGGLMFWRSRKSDEPDLSGS